MADQQGDKRLIGVTGQPPQTVGGTIYDVPVTTGQYVGASFGSAYEDDLGFQLFQKYFPIEENKIPDRDKILSDAKRLGVDISKANPDELSDAELFTIVNRQSRQKLYEHIKARKPDGVISSILGGGASFAGAFTAPSAAVTMAVPVLSAERVAAMTAKYGATAAGRIGTQVAVGAAEGGVINAALEPYHYAMSKSLGDDYTAYDSFLNIAFGFGGGATVGGVIGLLGERAIAKALSSIPKQDQAALVQAGAYKLARDGDIDVEPLLNAYVKRHLLTSVSSLPENKIGEIDVRRISFEQIKKGLSDADPEFRVRIADLEQKAQYAGKNIYERALNDYNKAENFEIKTPSDASVKENALASLEKEYGPGFKKEAEDYDIFSKKKEQIENTPDKRRLKTLAREVKELDDKYDGRFSKAYDEKVSRKTEADAEYQSAKQELDKYIATKNLDMVMKRMELEDQYGKELKAEKEKFATTSSTRTKDIIAKNADEVDRIIKQSDEMDDIESDIASMKSMSDEFEQRTGISLGDDTEIAEFNPKEIVDKMRKFINCMRA